ncbi:hypothetical protein [Bacillus sp. T33-2]|uniref:hypothetical protein n=1 Tax=Bacillus sp. T33-2 TaxID=2054168 RepID=UPI0027E3F4B1|nr:hypothetical protein [Bacillus sp. T33-2]
MDGQIISGEFDDGTNEFVIHKVKDFYTQSIIKKSQFLDLYQYLKKHEHDQDGQIITLYDQMPIRISQAEIKRLLSDLEKLKEMYD